MRYVDVEQGSPEWIKARLGVVTASEMDRVITPKTRKPSASQDKYLAKLCAEWFLGAPLDDYASPFMERGTEMEPQAASAYAFENEIEVEAVGICLRDDGKVGASPDRLVGADGLLEIKCPSAETHMSYLLCEGNLIEAYWCQLQGQLWVTGRAWVDAWSHSPVFPRVCVRVERDEEFIAALAAHVDAFVLKVDAAKAKLAALKAEKDAAEHAASVEADPFCSVDTGHKIVFGTYTRGEPAQMDGGGL